MLYLWVDEPYKTSYSWYERYNNLKQVSRVKRIDIIEIENLQEIPASDNNPVVLIRSASKHFVTSAVISANRNGVYPIVIANIPPNAGLHCSTVGANMREDTLQAIEYLEALGCNSIAFFGVNHAPFSDEYRAEIFHSRKNTGDIYYMDTSFDDTLKQYLIHAQKYDGIIVTNSATAVALVNALKENGFSGEKMPKILSFGRLLMMQYYTPGITTICDDINNLGEIVFKLYKMILRCGNSIEASIYLPSIITPRSTTNYTQPNESKQFARYEYPYQENKYYESSSISEVMQMEKILQQSDDIDLEIIFGLIRGKTYDKMSEQLFMNRNAIDYRVQKLKRISAQKNVSDLKLLLRRFFDN